MTSATPTSRVAEQITTMLASVSITSRAVLGPALPEGTTLPETDLPDPSPAGAQRIADTLRECRSLLAGTGDDDPLTVAVLDTFLRLGEPGVLIGSEGSAFFPHLTDFYGYGKPLLEYNEVLTSMPLDSTHDAQCYLERLDGFGGYVDGILETLDHRSGLGLRSTAESIERTVAQLDALCGQDAADNNLVTHLGDSLVAAGVDGEAAISKAVELMRTRLQPSYARLAEHGRELLATSRESLGMCAQPGGDGAYRYAVRSSTSNGWTPEHLHERGLDEVARLHDEIRRRFSRLGFDGADVGDLYRQLAGRDSQKYAPGDRDAVIRDVEDVLGHLDVVMRQHFNAWPDKPCLVEVVTADLEPTMPSHVRPPNRPGQPFTFGLNVADALAGTRDETHVLAWHEAIPGHALQMALAGARTDLPAIRTVLSLNAYSEGWAKYAETLPLVLGIWDDPYLELARLRYELFSTVNLVADTGCNLLGWDAGKVATYVAWATGDDATLPRMVPMRAIHTPAQLLGYKVGMLAFEDALIEARRLWTSEFSYNRFHDAVLNAGCVPLHLLNGLVQRG